MLVLYIHTMSADKIDFETGEYSTQGVFPTEALEGHSRELYF